MTISTLRDKMRIGGRYDQTKHTDLNVRGSASDWWKKTGTEK